MKHRIKEAIRRLDHQMFFPYLSEEETKGFFISKEIKHYELNPASLVNSSPDIAAYFTKCTLEWPLEKFHFCYPDGCIIEPSSGWGVTKKNSLIPQSIWNSYIHKVNKPLYLKYLVGMRRKVKLKTAISLQYAWRNYWHFQNDLLGQLHLADLAGLARDTPIIIPKGLSEMAYFKEIVALSDDLKSRNWVLQDEGTYIFCEKAHFFNTFWDHRENFDAVLDYMNLRPALQEKSADNKRIFVSRHKSRGRNIQNIEDLENLIKKFGFEIVDCDNMSIIQQQELFRNSKYVIGIHGAGLTNIIYRQGKPMKLLELFSDNYLNPSYYWLCRQYEYEYFSISGKKFLGTSPVMSNFTVDLEELESKMNIMLKEEVIT